MNTQHLSIPQKYFETRQFRLFKCKSNVKSQLMLPQQAIRIPSYTNENQDINIEKKTKDHLEATLNTKQSEFQVHQLNQENLQLVTKNKILTQRLKQQQQTNQELQKEISKLQEIIASQNEQVKNYESKMQKYKLKKKDLKDQIETLNQELEELHEKYQEDETPLSHGQLFQIIQYLQSRASQQQWLSENMEHYQNQEIDPDTMTYEQLLELEEQMGSVSKALSKEAIKAIPKRILEDDNVPDDKCTICQFEFQSGEKVRDLPCTHIYHSQCIKGWLSNNRCCPLCKEEIE